MTLEEFGKALRESMSLSYIEIFQEDFIEIMDSFDRLYRIGVIAPNGVVKFLAISECSLNSHFERLEHAVYGTMCKLKEALDECR